MCPHLCSLRVLFACVIDRSLFALAPPRSSSSPLLLYPMSAPAAAAAGTPKAVVPEDELVDYDDEAGAQTMEPEKVKTKAKEVTRSDAQHTRRRQPRRAATIRIHSHERPSIGETRGASGVRQLRWIVCGLRA